VNQITHTKLGYGIEIQFLCAGPQFAVVSLKFAQKTCDDVTLRL